MLEQGEKIIAGARVLMKALGLKTVTIGIEENKANAIDHLKKLVGSAQDVHHKSELELFCELYEIQNNQPMSEEQRAFVLNLIESIKEEQK